MVQVSLPFIRLPSIAAAGPACCPPFKDHCMNRALSLVLAAALAGPLAAQDAPRGEGGDGGPHPLLRTVDRIARQTPAIRGLELRENVPTDVMDRPALEALMQKMLRDEYPPEMIELAEKAYKALDLIAADVDLIEAFSAFATSQVAAFYEPDTKRIYVLDDLREMMIEMAPGVPAEMAAAMIEPMITNTLAHEFTHALQDQHFDLNRLIDASKHDDDMALAVHALIEGDAMIAGTAVMLGSAAQALAMSPDAAAMSAMGATLTPGLAEAPAIFRESLLFPYVNGWVFSLRIAKDEGFAAIDRALRDPPISTEQVLHPEKYLAREAPLAVGLPELEGVVSERLIGANVMGELQTRILLGGSPDAIAAAEGWGGDAYAVFEAAAGEGDLLDRLRFVWVTVWDTEADAEEFAIEYAAQVRRRAHGRTGSYPEVERSREDGVRTWRMATRPGAALIELRAEWVIAVEGFEADEAARALEAVRDSTVAPKSLELKAPAEAVTP
jgi:hypothetical protein